MGVPRGFDTPTLVGDGRQPSPVSGRNASAPVNGRHTLAGWGVDEAVVGHGSPGDDRRIWPSCEGAGDGTYVGFP